MSSNDSDTSEGVSARTMLQPEVMAAEGEAALVRAIRSKLSAEAKAMLEEQDYSPVLVSAMTRILQPAPQPDIELELDAESSQGLEPKPLYATVQDWVEQWLVPAWRQKLDESGQRGGGWCPQWWRHTIVVVRLEALWRAFEALRLEPGTGMSVWLRDHADHHMAVLTNPDGPMSGCSPDRGHDIDNALRPLKVEPPQPSNLFTVTGEDQAPAGAHDWALEEPPDDLR